ncbi:hypothetical protein DRW03_23295 [Corallococcus sp. H22C18031201]|nr:hypothetical protein DRW03_23295 [Corallococcus sp. H22C18031201]
MRHLDTQALRDLEAGEPQAVAHFREHLAAPCDTCEDFLATHDGPGLLDGLADAALLGQGPKPLAPALDEVGLARIRRALRGPSSALGRWSVALGAIAACVLALVLVPRAKGPGPETGVKGPGGRIALELAVVARGSDGHLRRVDPGAVVPEGDVLLLRYHATEAGSALLFQQRAGQPPELMGRFALESGTHDLEGPEGLTGVSLEGEAGGLTLWLVGAPGEEPLSPEEVGTALRTGAPPREGPLSVERFDVRIQNGQNPR